MVSRSCHCGNAGVAAAGEKIREGSGGAEQQIQKLEEQTKEASLKNDTAWFEKTLADDFIGVGGTGLVSDKAPRSLPARTAT